MARAKTSNIIGLNIEPGHIAAAQVTVNGGLVVEQGASARLDLDVVRDGEVVEADALAEALRDLWREHKLDKRVRIGVANARTVVRTMDLPPIQDPKQLRAAVYFRAADEIPMPMDAAVLDFQSVGLVDTPDGQRQRVILVAARRDMISAMLGAARAADLKPDAIDLSAFAMIRALRRPITEQGAEAFVSVGGLTNLAVSTGGLCSFTRVAGSGLEGMAVELAERRELTLEHARMWLQHVGLEPELEAVEGDPDIIADARAVLLDGARRIGVDIRASLDYYHAQVTEGPGVHRVVLTGPAIAVPGFPELLQRELALEVEARAVSGPEGADLDRLQAGCLSVAAGLAIEEGPA